MGTLLIRNKHPKYLQKNVFLEVPGGGAYRPTIPSRLDGVLRSPMSAAGGPRHLPCEHSTVSRFQVTVAIFYTVLKQGRNMNPIDFGVVSPNFNPVLPRKIVKLTLF